MVTVTWHHSRLQTPAEVVGIVVEMVVGTVVGIVVGMVVVGLRLVVVVEEEEVVVRVEVVVR